MRWNPHSELEGRHAFLAPSKYHWIRYDPEKLLESFDKHMTAAMGTKWHALANQMISMGQKAPDTHKTFDMYVNDCVGFGMKTEVPLKYSELAFGTADAISFVEVNVDGTSVFVLRIFDLKMGITRTSMEQLECYAALFCLEYKQNPYDILYDLRIYQNDDMEESDTDPHVIAHIMERYREANELLMTVKGV